jgi:WD40 repeat protein
VSSKALWKTAAAGVPCQAKLCPVSSKALSRVKQSSVPCQAKLCPVSSKALWKIAAAGVPCPPSCLGAATEQSPRNPPARQPTHVRAAGLQPVLPAGAAGSRGVGPRGAGVGRRLLGRRAPAGHWRPRRRRGRVGRVLRGRAGGGGAGPAAALGGGGGAGQVREEGRGWLRVGRRSAVQWGARGRQREAEAPVCACPPQRSSPPRRPSSAAGGCAPPVDPPLLASSPPSASASPQHASPFRGTTPSSDDPPRAAPSPARARTAASAAASAAQAAAPSPRPCLLSPSPLLMLTGHGGDVLEVAWSRCRLMLTASADQTARLWFVDLPSDDARPASAGQANGKLGSPGSGEGGGGGAGPGAGAAAGGSTVGSGAADPAEAQQRAEPSGSVGGSPHAEAVASAGGAGTAGGGGAGTSTCPAASVADSSRPGPATAAAATAAPPGSSPAKGATSGNSTPGPAGARAAAVAAARVPHGECLRSFVHPDIVTSAAFHPTDPARIVTGCADGKVRGGSCSRYSFRQSCTRPVGALTGSGAVGKVRPNRLPGVPACHGSPRPGLADSALAAPPSRSAARCSVLLLATASPPHCAFVCSPRPALTACLVCLCGPRPQVRVWSVPDGAALCSTSVGQDMVTRVLFTADAKRVLAGTLRGKVRKEREKRKK